MLKFLVLCTSLAAACGQFWKPYPAGLSLDGRLLRGFEVYRMGFTRGQSLKIPEVVIQRPLPEEFITELKDYLDWCPMEWKHYNQMLLEWREDFDAERDRSREGLCGTIDLIAGHIVSWHEVKDKYLDFMSVIQEVKGEGYFDPLEPTKDLSLEMEQLHILEVQKGVSQILMVTLMGAFFIGVELVGLLIFWFISVAIL